MHVLIWAPVFSSLEWNVGRCGIARICGHSVSNFSRKYLVFLESSRSSRCLNVRTSWGSILSHTLFSHLMVSLINISSKPMAPINMYILRIPRPLLWALGQHVNGLADICPWMCSEPSKIQENSSQAWRLINPSTISEQHQHPFGSPNQDTGDHLQPCPRDRLSCLPPSPADCPFSMPLYLSILSIISVLSPPWILTRCPRLVWIPTDVLSWLTSSAF